MQRVTELMERKRRVVNNKAVGELMAVLKERLTETNLNLRAKVLVCINRVVHAIGGAAVEYASVLLPSMLRLCGEAKQNVVDALFAALTTWVEADEMQRELLFNAIGSYLSVGLKIPKGRLALLTWMNKFTALMNAKTVAAIASDLLDCLTDKVAAVRMQAQLVLETAAKLVPRSTLEQFFKGRPSPDVSALRQVFDLVYASAHPSETPQTPQDPQEQDPQDSRRPSEASKASAAQEPLTEAEKRAQALANRSRVRVLRKPKSGEGYKARFSNVKSSIPKPIPRNAPVSRISDGYSRASVPSTARLASSLRGDLRLDPSVVSDHGSLSVRGDHSEVNSVAGDYPGAFFLSRPVAPLLRCYAETHEGGTRATQRAVDGLQREHDGHLRRLAGLRGPQLDGADRHRHERELSPGAGHVVRAAIVPVGKPDRERGRGTEVPLLESARAADARPHRPSLQLRQRLHLVADRAEVGVLRSCHVAIR